MGVRRVRPDPHTAVPFPAQAELRSPRRAPRHDRAQPRHADACLSAAAQGRRHDGHPGPEGLHHHGPPGRRKSAPCVQPQISQRRIGAEAGHRCPRLFGIHGAVQRPLFGKAPLLHDPLPAAVRPVCRRENGPAACPARCRAAVPARPARTPADVERPSSLRR